MEENKRSPSQQRIRQQSRQSPPLRQIQLPPNLKPRLPLTVIHLLNTCSFSLYNNPPSHVSINCLEGDGMRIKESENFNPIVSTPTKTYPIKKWYDVTIDKYSSDSIKEFRCAAGNQLCFSIPDDCDRYETIVNNKYYLMNVVKSKDFEYPSGNEFVNPIPRSEQPSFLSATRMNPPPRISQRSRSASQDSLPRQNEIPQKRDIELYPKPVDSSSYNCGGKSGCNIF